MKLHAGKPSLLTNKALGHSRERFGGQVKQLMFTDAVVLLKSFVAKTYYRTINGVTELRHDTADKVRKSIDELYKIQQADQDT